MSCPSLENWTAWVLGELAPDTEDELTGHLFECAACTSQAESVERLVTELRGMLPPLLTPERRKRLEAELGTEALAIVNVSPGEQATIELGADRPLGFWVMRADVQGAERLDCEFLTPDGAPFATFRDVPFDAERGELIVCCQLHYQALGADEEMRVRVSSVGAAGSRPIAEYRLNHIFHV
ncbi:MAG TPA: zf-HC2 domain-containing protein [Polyangiaceae bacterium]